MAATKAMLSLKLRTQHIDKDVHGYNCWKEQISNREIPARETAIVICDMWDNHWSRAAAERAQIMATRVNEVVTLARNRGVTIIHAPSETMEFYKETKARRRMLDVPRAYPEHRNARDDRPLPIDFSDRGSDSGEHPDEERVVWTRQNPIIEIDDQTDAVSDDGREIYSFLEQNGLKLVLLMGVHTNICILERSFAIKQMVRWGVDIVLVRDLTDSMYNPLRPPYVSHEEGTRLVVEYIEKFWCPTVSSQNLCR